MSDSDTLKKALYAIKKLKQQLLEQQNDHYQPIAIIGMSCRFPEANNIDEYWQLLCNGKNVISPIPEQRWELLKDTDERCIREQAEHCRGGFLSAITGFDAYFFGITPREAVRMDPQQRMMLEVAYEAFEDAGISIEALSGSNTGVFTSLYASQYGHMQQLESDMDALYIPTGNAVSMAANRLSYLFDLRGPSIVFDTACSSSLVALHLACLNLQTKSCETAIVTAANINLLPSINLLLSQAKMLSQEGQCKTFDASADGYVPGEGIGAVVLKPLDKAILDKDRIYAVIAGSGVNQDGKTNGLTAPNGLQQEALLKSVYKIAKIDPHDISYVECHGTGTFLGDPIEIQALGEVLGQQRKKEHPCLIGSVKTNLGHLEPAAGIASVIKVALALKYSKIPPHLNFKTPNPHIEFNKYHLSVPLKIEEWPNYGNHRLAGISGFGFGGTNAHLVVREYNDETPVATHPVAARYIFTLSAKDPVALKLLVDAWCEYLNKNKSLDIAQLCYNVQSRRSHFIYRIAIIINSTLELYQCLNSLSQKDLTNITENNNVLTNLNSKVPIDESQDPLTHIAQSYVNRSSIDWKLKGVSGQYQHIDMPNYPWQHQDYWPIFKKSNDLIADIYPFQHKQIASPLSTIQFEFQFNTKIMPEIKDTFNFLHAGYYLEMLAVVVNELYQQTVFTAQNVIFSSPIYVPDNTTVQVQLILEKLENNSFAFIFYSRSRGQDWTQHTTGNLYLAVEAATHTSSLNTIKNRCHITGTSEKFDARVLAMNMPLGDSIHWTKNYWASNNEILCELATPKSAQKNQSFKLNVHLGVIDGCIQSLFMLLPDQLIKPYIASSIERIAYYGVKNNPSFILSSFKNIYSEGMKYDGDFNLLDSNGEIIVECNNICMTQLNENIQIQKADKNVKIDFNSSLAVSEYLVDQVAKLFSMPKNDIDINQSLRDMGIDSLMAIVFSSAIESDLSVTYPMQDILKGPSIFEITCTIIGKNYKSETFLNPWISYRKIQKNAKFRLFCFPYGGSGASIYADWHKYLPDTIEVCPIQLPGRENRIDESPINNISQLIEQLIDNLRSELTIPFAFFGHSFGSLIAFELARTLRECNLPVPVHLFSSAFPDPRIPTKSLDNVIVQLQKIGVNLFELTSLSSVSSLCEEKLMQLSTIFSDNGLIEYGSEKMSKDIMKILLPIFSGDMCIVKSYQYYDALPLDLPVTVFLGQKDTWVAYEDHLGWKEHTSQKCDFYSFDSGHLFIREEQVRKDVLNKIVKDLCHVSIDLS